MGQRLLKHIDNTLPHINKIFQQMDVAHFPKGRMEPLDLALNKNFEGIVMESRNWHCYPSTIQIREESVPALGRGLGITGSPPGTRPSPKPSAGEFSEFQQCF